MSWKKREADTAPEAEEVKQETAEETVEAADTPGDEPAAEVPAEPAAEEAESPTAALEAELAEFKEQHLRLMAEYDNFRKRTAREKLALSADIKSDCIAALLPVLDNLERALDAANADGDSMRKGVEMVLNQTNSIFEGMGVASYGKVGDAFDPQIHHCVSSVEADDSHPADCITLVMQKGYMIGDKVIRPAMVQVAN